MSSQKMKIEEAINLCNYQKHLKNNFVKFLQITYGSDKHKLYLFSRNAKAPKLFLLEMQIPIKHKNQKYDIAILVYFPLNFPEIEPEIFIEKIGKMRLDKNCEFFIDPDTFKINYSIFFKWGKTFDSFKEVIKELYNQFNLQIPVYSYEDINSDAELDNDGDCCLKKELCVEIELIKPVVIKENPINFDEKMAKRSLVQLLQVNLSQKINLAIQPILETSTKLEKLKENIIKKIKEYDTVECKESTIRQTMYNLYKELDFSIDTSNNDIKQDLNNLDTVLNINNKNKYLTKAKEEVVEEYLLIIKKSYERQNIDFSTALNLIRTNSRMIFFLRYKNRNNFGIKFN